MRNYNDNLSIYNDMSPEDKQFVSPRGKYTNVPDERILYAETEYIGGKPAGYIEIYKYNGKSERVGFIILAVHPNYRGKGLAKKMIMDAIKNCKAKGVHKLVYRLDSKNIGSDRLVRSIPGAKHIRDTKTEKVYEILL